MEGDRSTWTGWRVVWGASWIGALAALAAAVIIGLVGFAVGAHEVARYVDWKKIRLVGLVFSIGGAFFSFVIGGWVAARTAGFFRAEPAMLHGAISWLLTVPILLALGSLGATSNFGGWFVGFAGAPAWVAVPSADPSVAAAVRNTALASVAALLLGLIGSVLGGWMASGEPMSLSHHRRRDLAEPRREEIRRTA